MSSTGSGDVLTLLEKVNVYPSLRSGYKRLIIVLGLLGDLDSFEYIQLLRKYLQLIEESDIKLLVIGIGNELARQRFCAYTSFPLKYLFAEQEASLHEKLGCSPGLSSNLDPFFNLLLMCSGISSPGTLKEVIRGYTGDRKSKQIFDSADEVITGILPNFRASLFENAGGSGFLRPFEMATLRLSNMVEVISNWNIYMHYKSYLTQRGATLLLNENDNLIYSYKPSNLLGYSENMSDPIGFLYGKLNNNYIK